MEEHKVMTGMLLVALVVSVVGTVITVDRLGGVNSANGLTGAAGGTGDLNITQDITISLPDSGIDFKNGKVDPSAGFATVDSGGNTVDGTWDNRSGSNGDNITVRNDGNVGVNITVQSNKQNGNHSTNSFICQSDAGGCGVGYENGGENNALKYEFTSANNEPSSCTTLGQRQFSKTLTDYGFCECLKTGSTEDEAVLNLQVGIPADAQGQKSATITFTSTAAGDGGC
tara:strand:- start:2260 stop:2943 length:684 start_codon:yes stop_codon:yes gene_type:complete